MYCVLCTVYCVLCTVYCVLCTVVSAVHYIVCSVWCVDCVVQHRLVHCSAVQCVVVQRTVPHDVACALAKHSVAWCDVT